MKIQRIALFLCAALAFTGVTLKGISEAQENKRGGLHRIVLEVTTEGEESWQAILNNVENVQKALGREQTQIEVVAHGKGLSLLLATNAPLKERLEGISKTGVVFAACENTMRRKSVKKEDLFPFTTTVPSGVAEVVLKQEANWSYIKGG
jgi:uncharacterized protein